MPEKDISYHRRWHSQFLFGSSPAPAPGQKRKANAWWWPKKGFSLNDQGQWVAPPPPAPTAPQVGQDSAAAPANGGPTAPDPAANEYMADGGPKG